jgi:1-acyl-sn-glycerol-3-phosphate acyltransferase
LFDLQFAICNLHFELPVFSSFSISLQPFLMDDFLSYLWYEIYFWATGPAFTLGFSLRTEGMRHIPKTGPALLVANHQCYLDPNLVGLAARRHLRYVARKTLFQNSIFSRIIRSLQAIPIDQEGIGLEEIRNIIKQLQAGQAVLVFPEGHRTPDGRIHPLKPGVALLIKKAQAPVVPVGIAGAYDAWPRQRPFPVPAPLFLPAQTGRIAVSISPALDGRELAEMPRQQMLDLLVQKLQKAHEKANRLRGGDFR